VNASAAVAGLGVGGIAVALAAQKTLENVIGGASVITDQPVRVGDWLKVGETTGEVIEIGLRSLRIVTPDRTVVSIPNGQIANATLENFSLRDKFWFHHFLGLRYGTSIAQLRSLLPQLSELLTSRPEVDTNSVRIRFLRFGVSSLDVELFAYIIARDFPHFLEIQQELLLGVLEVVQAAGTDIAVPSTAVYLAGTGMAQKASVDRLAAQLSAS
jgi:MscS family membrane protein